MAVYRLGPTAIDLAEQTGDGGWDQGGAATVAHVDKEYGVWNDAEANHCFWVDNTGPNEAQIYFTMDVLPPVFVIESVSLLVRIQRSGGTFTGAEHRPFIRIGGTNYYIDGWSNTLFGYYNQEITWTTNPATALPFTRADVNSLKAGLYARNLDTVLSTGPFNSAILLTVVASGAPGQLEQSRDAASRHQWRHSHSVRSLEGQVVPGKVGHALNMMGPIRVSHAKAPEASGDGWLPRPWQTREFQLRSWEPRDDGTVVVGGPERRELRAVYAESGVLPDNNSPASEDGNLRLHRGATFTFSRSGAVYSKNPGSGLFTLVNANEKAFGEHGLECIGTFTQEIQYSAFQTGNITGWTKAGTGTNGSDVASDTTFVIGSDLGETIGWDADSTGVTQNALFVAGSPHSADLSLTSTATSSFSANTKLIYSIWFAQYNTGAILHGALQRQVDNKYYNFSNRTWQVGIYWQDLTQDVAGVSAGTNARGSLYGHQSWHFDQIDVGASATTVKLIVGMPSGTTSAAAARAFAAQVGSSTGSIGFPPLLTTNSTASRNHSQNKVSHTVTRTILEIACGTVGVTFRPMWTGSLNASSTVRFLWYLHYDDENHVAVYWSNRASASGAFGQGTGFIFQIKSSGTYYRTMIDTSVIDVLPDKELRIVARYTGVENEFSLGQNRMTLFMTGAHINRQKSSDVAYVGPEVADGYLEIGRSTTLSSNAANGNVTRFVSRPFPMTDEECYRFDWL